MKKICVLTATRAEYGLLSSLIRKMAVHPDIDMRLAVCGMHLSPEFGLTYHEIEADGIRIDRSIETLMSSDTPSAISKSMGIALAGFSEYFAETIPDALLVLGDRYEVLAVCIAAMNAGIPVFHIHGGEITEGAVDDAIRHCISKMSYLHFTSTEEYRKRVIQLGEAPDRVFNVGALGVENALGIECMSTDELQEALGWKLSEKYALLTFHPVTLERGTASEQIDELLNAIGQFPDVSFIATKANADAYGRVINSKIADYAETHENLRLFDSLGKLRYLSAMKNAAFVIGNSSSGIIEAPAFGIPTVNIGDRQKGRARGNTVIDCAPNCDSIARAIERALDMETDSGSSPYGSGQTSDKILDIILKLDFDGINLKKQFYDLNQIPDER
ncbi:GDP/UDP-N,N'-diacetylbacillosamine 2-epimerase (hydrolysing) [Lachnospiraceae bacterium XBB2008]|nr:GDP/UDP-N,N'-diacetylbacillosamine 2-epimerase (hydrolysing) [Lachnospiraceae bacterium XBB2008]